MAVDWNNKVLNVLEFKRTSDQRHTYRERGESRARAQHNVLVRSLEKVAEEAEGENRGMENKADNLCGGHMWISAYANIQQQSQGTWGCRVQTKHYPEGTRACDSMSCSMHRIRSCVHTLRRDQESGIQAGVEIRMWKKLFKGWTASFEVWREAAR